MKAAVIRIIQKIFRIGMNPIISQISVQQAVEQDAPNYSSVDIYDRKSLLSKVSLVESVLEIGPFDRPLVIGSNVSYLDVLTQEQLKERAIAISGHSPNNVPFINFVGKSGVVRETQGMQFDAIVSSHLLEHQPDLIGHLIDVVQSLKPGGMYIAIIPDKGKCFDYFIPTSKIPEILAAYFEGRRKPSIRSVIEHRAFTVHDYLDLSSQNPFKTYSNEILDKVHAAFHEFSTQEYVDVHCWQFTLESFMDVMRFIQNSNLLSYEFDFSVHQNNSELDLILKLRS